MVEVSQNGSGVMTIEGKRFLPPTFPVFG
jgi:hypothetical protein